MSSKRTSTLCLSIALLAPSFAQANVASTKITFLQSIFSNKAQDIRQASSSKSETNSDNGESVCSAQARFARTAMTARQYGVNKEVVVDIIEDSKDSDISKLIDISFIRSLVDSSYETPLERRTPEKREVINTFSDLVKKECEASLQEDGGQEEPNPTTSVAKRTTSKPSV